LLTFLFFIAVILYYKIIPLAWYWNTIPALVRQNSLGFSTYRVTVEAMPIAGIKKQLSGLTYNPRTQTLFAVTNVPAVIVELSLDGRVLRRIPVENGGDIEDITYVGEQTFIVVEERQQQIYWVQIDDKTKRVDSVDAPRIILDLQWKKNRSFEGIWWDKSSQCLFVTREKSPLQVLAISGLASMSGLMPEESGAPKYKALNLQIREWLPRQPYAYFMRDLSAVSQHNATGHLLLLSDESKLIAEYDQQGRLAGIMPLWFNWHGLKRSIRRPEGLALTPNGTIFIVSEPNLFYRFEPRAQE
jgi:uncharacterized protein YjiK